MRATITITGTPDELSALLPQLGSMDVPTLGIRQTDEGWTIDRATSLLSEIPAGALYIFKAVVSGGGEVRTEALRDGDWETLRGRVGPITKAMRRLEKRGKLPEGLPRPIAAKYAGDGPGFRKAASIVMPHELLPVFAKALVSVDISSKDSEVAR